MDILLLHFGQAMAKALSCGILSSGILNLLLQLVQAMSIRQLLLVIVSRLFTEVGQIALPQRQCMSSPSIAGLETGSVRLTIAEVDFQILNVCCRFAPFALN